MSMIKPRSKQIALLLVTVATLLSLSVWFSTNAVSTALEIEKSIDQSSMAVLTIAAVSYTHLTLPTNREV